MLASGCVLACVLLGNSGRIPVNGPVLPPADLAAMLIDEYINYPYGKALFPYNYCLVKDFAPLWAKDIIGMVC